METTRKILSFHREERNSDPNNPQSILLDFVSSCQNLRIWSLNTETRDYLNNEQLQKGKQIDEWWKQASKGTLKHGFYCQWNCEIKMWCFAISWWLTRSVLLCKFFYLMQWNLTIIIPCWNSVISSSSYSQDAYGNAWILCTKSRKRIRLNYRKWEQKWR